MPTDTSLAESLVPHASSDATAPYQCIDHIALAVRDLEQAIHLFRDVLGFQLKRRRCIRGQRTGMTIAEMEVNGILFVLCQGNEPESQVSQLVEQHGVGIAHIALAVDDVATTVETLRLQGMDFDTEVICGPGLTQAFSSRCPHTGLSFEFIRRNGEDSFLDSNIQQLFDELERANRY